MTTKRSWKGLQQYLRPIVRKASVIDKRRIYLNAMVLASPPARVRNEVAKHRRAIGKDPAGYILHKNSKTDKTRIIREGTEAAKRVAEYLGLKDLLNRRRLEASDVIAHTTSTTMGLGLLANGIKAVAGQEVLISIHDFSYHRAAWQLRANRGDLQYREFRMYRDSTVTDLEDRMCDAVESQIQANTRVLALTWVDSGTGVKLPVSRIAAHLRQVNARRPAAERILFVLDAVHGFGVENTMFEALGCDFFVAGCHKWIFAPSGTGIVCALPEAWAEVMPTIPTFLGSIHPGFRNSPGGIGAYEHAWAVKAAFDFHMRIGKAEIEQHTITLARRLKKGLSRISGVRVVTPTSDKLSSGVVCCAVPDYQDLCEQLAKMGIMAMTSHDADDNYFVRFSPSLLNTAQHIDKTVRAVARILHA